MAESPNAPARDDDPVHPNFGGIVFFATTDKAGVIATPATGQTTPPVSFLPLTAATATAGDVAALIASIRVADPKSYLADFLDEMLEDFTSAIHACRPEQPH